MTFRLEAPTPSPRTLRAFDFDARRLGGGTRTHEQQEDLEGSLQSQLSAGQASAPRQVTCIIIGAGQRGSVYQHYAVEHPDRLKVVAVAEPRDWPREAVAKRHGVTPDMIHTDWRPLAGLPRFADCAIISTQDRDHEEPAIAFAQRGYHLLVEKPLAVTPQGCAAIADAVRRAGVIFAVGHVLRYTPYLAQVRALLDSGALGRVVNMQHLEPVGHWHFAHSYVRGAWRRTDSSAPLLMSKCCHDVDLVRYLVGQPCAKVTSFGSLTTFREDQAPPGSVARCMECPLKAHCAFSATRIYLDRVTRDGHTGWPVSAIVDERPTPQNVAQALRDGPYGRCVWRCDNDVCDQQVASFEFTGGATATLTTVAFTEAICQRRTRIFCSRGELDCNGEDTIRHYDFATGATTVHKTPTGPPAGTALRGHGGADFFLIDAFVRAVATGDVGHIRSGLADTLESHLIVFAAEEARTGGKVVDVPAFMSRWSRPSSECESIGANSTDSAALALSTSAPQSY